MRLWITILITPIFFATLACRDGSVRNSTDEGSDGTKTQCAHWCILRSCELLGVPMDLSTIKKRLPSNPDGHSVLEISETLQSLGLASSAEQENLQSLREGSFPVIVHIGSHHFVTVSSIVGSSVRAYDGAGRLVVMSASRFESRWDGVTLHVRRPENLQARRGGNSAGLPAAEFETLIIDRGEVPCNGEELVYDFRFTNKGSAPLIIKDVRADCKCMGVDKPEAPIAPGAVGTITLRYMPRYEGGGFTHNAVVRSNDPWFPLVRLTAAGNTDTRVRVAPESCNLGKIAAGSTGSGVVFLHYTGDEPLEIVGLSCANDLLQVSHFALTEAVLAALGRTGSPYRTVRSRPGNTQVIVVKMSATQSDRGKRIRETVRIATNVTGWEDIAIPVSAEIVAPVTAYPSVLYCEVEKPGEEQRRSIVLAACDGRAIAVKSVKAGAQEVQFAVIDEPCPTGQVRLQFTAKGADMLGWSALDIELRVSGADGYQDESVVLTVMAYRR